VVVPLIASSTPLVLRQGDAELARRILAETRVASTPARPGASEYFGALFEAAMRWIGSVLAKAFSGGGGGFPWLELVALLAIASAIVLVILALVRRLVARARRARQALSRRPGPGEVAVSVPVRRDAAAWKAEIEARLSRGDVAGALEAVWWWLAESLAAGEPVDSSWTTRDLLARAATGAGGRSRGRAGVLSAVGVELDRMMYGRRRPSPAEVRASWQRFEQMVG